MKRALSLIIVLAMVLCMIPFSAFAEANFNVAGDFVDGDIILDANDGISYLWTATETGTLEVFANPVVPEAVEGEEPTTLPDAKIYINGAAYTEGGVSVVEGKSYEISFEDDNCVGGKVTVWAKFTGLIGTETNPYIMWNPAVEGEDGIDFPENNSTTTIEIAANESVYYMLHFYQGYNVTFTGNGVKVSVLGKTVDGTEAGFVTMAFENDPTMFKEVLVKFTNNSAEAATYTVTAELPNNAFSPLAVTDGEYTATMVEGDDGYYYSYTAAEAGILNITVNAVDAEGKAIGWTYVANNVTAGAYGETQWSDSNPAVNPAEVAVSAGDVVEVMVNTYDPANEWTAPAGVITTTFELVDAPEEPPVDPEPEEPPVEEPEVIVIGELPYEVSYTGNHNKDYSYTATETGYLYVTTSDGEEGGFINFNCMPLPYGDGFVVAMDADATVEINLASYWSADEDVFDYTFSWVTEIEPDGSEGFPYEVGSLLNTTATLANDTENAVYYVYIAEKDGMIYNSFYESAEPVTAGEKVLFYVPAGGITVYYLPPVAMIGDAEYTTIDAAVAAAVSGDTIVLKDSVVAEAGIVLPAGANLDLGTYTLTAPYVVAFAGSEIVGDVASAAIVASNLVAANVTISDVEYAWTANEGTYTLVEVVPEEPELPPVVEEPEVASYDGEVMGLNAAIAAAAADFAKDGVVKTVSLVAAADYTGKSVIIEPGVALDVVNYSLTAQNVVGLNGSYLISSKRYSKTSVLTNIGRVFVEQGNMVLSETTLAPNATSTNKIMPLWLSDSDCYVFANLSYATTSIISNYDTEADKFSLTKFDIGGGDFFGRDFVNNGSEVYGIKFIVRASWAESTGRHNDDYVFFDEFVKNAATSSYDFSYSLTGMTSALGVDMSTFDVYLIVASDCGATWISNDLYNA